MLFKNYDTLVLNGATPTLQQKRKDVLEMLTAAVDAVHPYPLVHRCFQGASLVFPSETIDLSTFEHLYVAGFGKASMRMAQAVCDAVPVKRGVVITNDPTARDTHEFLEVVVGGHPLPDEGSIKGAEKILDLFSESGEDDCVIVLISGGGSSLFCKPRIPLSDLQKTYALMLRSGATIEEINAVRKHLSMVKGGQLITQTQAVCISLIISDIVHDPLMSIASGPTAPDPTTFYDVQEILIRYRIWEQVPATARAVVKGGMMGRIPETLKPKDPAFDTVFNFIIANNERACQGALTKARLLGYDGTVLTTSLTGEARDVGRSLVRKVSRNHPSKKTVYISGGETTVTLQGNGSGGRNQELVLGCLEDIAGKETVISSFATDGIDGSSTAAGALADGYSLSRAQEKTLLPSRFLQDNNSFGFFKELGDVLCTGPTGTNVMDIQIVVP